MALVRFGFGSDIDDMRREVNRVFSGMPTLGFDLEPAGFERWYPAMDAVEEGDEVKVVLDVPGMREQDIDVQVDGDVLTISGSRQIERAGGDRRWRRFERATGSFERSLQMPGPIDADKVRATFVDGVLTVRLPSSEPQVEPARHIAIEKPAG